MTSTRCTTGASGCWSAACYERKLAEGKTPKEALRSLKRRVSDAIFTHLQADARRTAENQD